MEFEKPPTHKSSAISILRTNRAGEPPEPFFDGKFIPFEGIPIGPFAPLH
jgi:hypothetical protein